MGPPSGEKQPGSHQSSLRLEIKWNSRIYLWFKLLMSDRSWYWMLSDEGRVGVCKFTSSVVSPLALSLPLFDSSALPQTWPRTLLYSLFPLFPTLRLLSSHIRHNSLYSSLTKSVPLFPLYIANDAWIEESFLHWIDKMHFFAYLFTISVPYHYSCADYQNCSDLKMHSDHLRLDHNRPAWPLW